MSIEITKADGTVEAFQEKKLRQSLKRAGATKAEIESIVRDITDTLTDGMTTQAIYRHAFTLLRQQETPLAARYSMRRALFNLGPTGFPFEDFLARLFQAEGYTTLTRLTVQGKCAEHELDVAAYTPEDSFVVEAKFHSRPGVKSDLQVALYTHARLLDLREQRVCTEDICGIKDLLLVTNTKFTRAAERYAECAGISLLSWTYPHKSNLQDRIEAAGIYPITVLTSFSQSDKRTLLENNIILCRDVLGQTDRIHSFGISGRKIDAAIIEARQLCKQ